MTTNFLTGEKFDVPFHFAPKGEIRISDCPDSDFLSFEDKVSSICGLWDLTMIGSEAIDIEYYYEQMTSGLEVTLVGLDGVFLEKDGIFANLHTDYEDNEYQPGSKAQLKLLKARIVKNNLTVKKKIFRKKS